MSDLAAETLRQKLLAAAKGMRQRAQSLTYGSPWTTGTVRDHHAALALDLIAETIEANLK